MKRVGIVGEGPSHLLGAFLATAFAQAAEARAKIPEYERRDFTLYADEVQNFATESFAQTLSEARNRRLMCVLAHQYFSQLPRRLQDAIIANCGNYDGFTTCRSYMSGSGRVSRARRREYRRRSTVREMKEGGPSGSAIMSVPPPASWFGAPASRRLPV